MTDKLTSFEITPREVVSYAASLAIKEAVAKGIITAEAEAFLVRRADEMILSLFSGDVLTIQDDGTYKSEPQIRPQEPYTLQ